MLLCQFCCGLAAVVSSMSCRKEKRVGNYYEAKAKSKSSLILIIVSGILGILGHVLFIIFYFPVIKKALSWVIGIFIINDNSKFMSTV